MRRFDLPPAEEHLMAGYIRFGEVMLDLSRAKDRQDLLMIRHYREEARELVADVVQDTPHSLAVISVGLRVLGGMTLLFVEPKAKALKAESLCALAVEELESAGMVTPYVLRNLFTVGEMSNDSDLCFAVVRNLVSGMMLGQPIH